MYLSILSGEAHLYLYTYMSSCTTTTISLLAEFFMVGYRSLGDAVLTIAIVIAVIGIVWVKSSDIKILSVLMFALGIVLRVKGRR